MSDKTINITMSIEYAQTAIDSLENDIELSSSGYANFRDVSEMTYYLRRAELLEMLLAAVREASVAEEPTEEAEGEDVYWSYSKPKSEGV
jgi:hypothetical protein